MNDQGSDRQKDNLHWSQKEGFGKFVSFLGAVLLGIVTITSFTSGETAWGYVMLVVFLIAITAFTLRMRRQKRDRAKS